MACSCPATTTGRPNHPEFLEDTANIGEAFSPQPRYSWIQQYISKRDSGDISKTKVVYYGTIFHGLESTTS